MEQEQLNGEARQIPTHVNQALGNVAVGESLAEEQPQTTDEEEPTREIPINEVLYENQPGLNNDHPNIFPGEN